MRSMKSTIASVDVSTRSKRRKAMWLVIELLEKIRAGEEMYMERMPMNFWSGKAYAQADYCVETIIAAIGHLSYLYWE